MSRPITCLLAALAIAMVLLGPGRVSAEVVNVAPTLGTASQSTTGFGMPASLANDGNLNNISHTATDDPSAWWEIDLGMVLPIERVVVHNRLACCQERLCNIVVSVLDAERAPVWQSEVLNPNNALGFSLTNIGGFDLDLVSLTGSAVEGRIVRVERTHDTDDACGGYYVSLAEVEVFVDDADIPVAIATQPQGGIRYVGDCHVFTVGLFNAENATSISYRWRKDGADIPGATGPRLVLGNLQEDDAGIYSVVVTADGNVLTSEPAELVIRGLNLARYGIATQSSLSSGGVPERAIDGNTSGVWGDGSITHTGNETDPWWQVELFADSVVDRVVLWNRTDACCVHRLQNFRVSALDSGGNEEWGEDFFTDGSYPLEPSFEIDLEGTTCRAIKVAKIGPDDLGEYWLSLAEVEVFGDGLVGPPDPRPNLARGCGTIARQSSEYGGGYPAARAIDGIHTNFTHTGALDESPTWEVDLGAEYDIALIVLHNRADCCQSRLRDVTVSILDAGGDIVWESDLLNPENELGVYPGGPPRIDVNLLLLAGGPVAGQIVRVHREPDPDLSGSDGQGNEGEPAVLSLAEVEVFAVPSDCPASGDTHCEDLLVDGPEDSYPGLYTLTAFADDDSGDPIYYTFDVDDGVGAHRRVGPQLGNSCVVTLGPGEWAISVKVDDDLLCIDETDDPTCSTQVDVADVENIAPQGVATQSSEHNTAQFPTGQYPAPLAIDGNYGNFTHTVAGNDGLGPATWDLEFAEDEPIGRVVLYNRPPNGSRLRDIRVYVLDAEDDVLYVSDLLNPENELGVFPLGPPTLTVDIEKEEGGAIVGRKVRVERLPDDDLSGSGGQGDANEATVLSLGEVEVFRGSGTPPERPRYRRGDADALDGVVNITDAIFVLNYLFQGGPEPPCLDAADADDEFAINITDGIYILSFLFLGGPEPPPPGPTSCGTDSPGEDGLDCKVYEPSC